MSKKKIIFIAENAGAGGVIYVINNLINGLRDFFDFEVILINYQWRNVPDASQLFQKQGINTYIIEITHKQNKYKALKRMAEIMKTADLIVASYIYELAAYSIEKLTVPLILMIHGDYEPEQKMLQLLKDTDIVDLFVPISQKIYQTVKEITGQNNVVYLRHAIPDHTPNKYIEQFSESFTITFIGRFNKPKGSDLLLQIGKKLYDRDKNISYIIITDGIGEKDFKTQWQPLNDTVFYSKISNEQVQNLLLQSHIILMPSRSEGLPLSLVEAMRKGVVPVVSDLRTGMRELVEDGKNGFLCPVGDIDCFVEKILFLKKNRDILSKFSNEAIKKVKQLFDYQTNLMKYKEVFEKTMLKRREKKYYLPYPKILGKLDKPYIPDFLFRLIKFIKNSLS